MKNRSACLFFLAAVTFVFLSTDLHSFQDNPAQSPSSDSKIFSPEQLQMHISELRKKLLETKAHQRAAFLCRELLLLKPQSIPVFREVIASPGVSIEVKDVAIRNLLSAAVPEIRPDALQFLKSEDAVYRRLAADALGQVGDAASVEALGTALQKEPSHVVRNAIVSALIRIDSGGARAILVSELHDRFGSVRALALAAVKETPETESVPSLWELMEDDYPGNSLLAAQALQKKLGVDSKKLGAYFEDSDLRHRTFAYLLAPSILPDPVSFFSEKNRRAELRAAIKSPSFPLRRAALECIKNALRQPCEFITESSWVRTLADAYLHEESPENRQILLGILSSCSRKGFVEAYRNEGKVIPMEELAARFICYDTDPVTIPVFLQALSDKELPIRSFALSILRYSTGYYFGFSGFYSEETPEVTPSLIKRWNDWWSERAAANVIERTAAEIDRALTALDTDYSDEKALQFFHAVAIVTGREFGFEPGSKLEEKGAAMQKFRSWWKVNKTREPLSWLLESVKEKGVENLALPSRYLLAYRAANCFGSRIYYNLPESKAELEKLNRDVVTWCEARLREAS
jgi:hypothetical protein